MDFLLLVKIIKVFVSISHERIFFFQNPFVFVVLSGLERWVQCKLRSIRLLGSKTGNMFLMNCCTAIDIYCYFMLHIG